MAASATGPPLRETSMPRGVDEAVWERAVRVVRPRAHTYKNPMAVVRYIYNEMMKAKGRVVCKNGKCRVVKKPCKNPSKCACSKCKHAHAKKKRRPRKA